MSFWQALPFQIFGIVVFLIVFVLPFYLVFGGGISKFALGPLRRRFRGLEVHEVAAHGDVSLFIPFIAIGNYWAQLKSIRAQASSSA